MSGHPASWDSLAEHPDVVQALAEIAAAENERQRREREVMLVYGVLDRLYAGSEEATWALATWLLKQAAATSPEAQAKQLQSAGEGVRWMRRYMRLYAPHQYRSPRVLSPLPRPRQGRAPRRVVHVPRRQRVRIRASSDDPDPGGEDDDDDDGRRALGPAPVCPRCESALNVRRRIPGLRPASWSCRWCLFQVWAADLREQARRLQAEAERITREEAA